MCAAIAASAAAPSPAAIASTIAACSSDRLRAHAGQPHRVRPALRAERARRRQQVLQQRVVGRVDDPPVQLHVEPQHRLGVVDRLDLGARHAVAQPGDLLGRGPLGGQRRRARLEQEPDLEEVLEPALGQREHELQRAQQLVHAERGDERPRAVPALEDVHRLERPDRLAHRRARDAERLRQAALGRQPLAGRKPAVEDHVLDRPDRLRHVGAAGQRLEPEVAHIAQNGS